MKNKLKTIVAAFSLLATGVVFAQCDDTNFNAWTAAQEDVAGTLEAVSPGLNSTSCKMQVQATANNSDRARVTDASPSCESSYRARFLFDVSNLGQLDPTERVKVFNSQCINAQNGGAVSCSNVGVVQFKLKGDNSGTGNIFRSFVIDESMPNADNRRKFDIPVGVGAGEEAVEIHWTRASAPGASDGTFKAWWGGNTTEATPDLSYNDLDNYNNCIDQANLGLIKANPQFSAGQTAVNFFFDEFESRRQTGIGVN
jgi:hypothetical protein